MALWFKPVAAGEPSLLEIREQQVSILFSAAAVIMMLLGLAWFYLQGGRWLIPGHHAGPVAAVIQSYPLDLVLMILGILLLCILPIARVALALWVHSRQKKIGEASIALVVLAELCLSLFWGGGG